jgi:hypothetical protein
MRVGWVFLTLGMSIVPLEESVPAGTELDCEDEL